MRNAPSFKIESKSCFGKAPDTLHNMPMFRDQKRTYAILDYKVECTVCEFKDKERQPSTRVWALFNLLDLNEFLFQT